VIITGVRKDVSTPFLFSKNEPKMRKIAWEYYVAFLLTVWLLTIIFLASKQF